MGEKKVTGNERSTHQFEKMLVYIFRDSFQSTEFAGAKNAEDISVPGAG